MAEKDDSPYESRAQCERRGHEPKPRNLTAERPSAKSDGEADEQAKENGDQNETSDHHVVGGMNRSCDHIEARADAHEGQGRRGDAEPKASHMPCRPEAVHRLKRYDAMRGTVTPVKPSSPERRSPRLTLRSRRRA